MLFKRLAHVCLHVKDLQRSLEFYRKVGLKDKFQFTRKGADYGRYMELADKSYIELFHEPKAAPSATQSLAHFCFESEDLAALMAHLDSQGVAYTPKKLGGDHTWQIWLEDPDGNKFEVHQYTDKSMQQQGGVMEADW